MNSLLLSQSSSTRRPHWTMDVVKQPSVQAAWCHSKKACSVSTSGCWWMLRTEHAGRRDILGMFQIPILLDPGGWFPDRTAEVGGFGCHFKWYWNCLVKDVHTLCGGVLVFWHISYCNARCPPLCSPLSFQHKGHYDRQCHNTHQQETPGRSHERGLELSPKGSVDQAPLEDATESYQTLIKSNLCSSTRQMHILTRMRLGCSMVIPTLPIIPTTHTNKTFQHSPSCTMVELACHWGWSDCGNTCQ